MVHIGLIDALCLLCHASRRNGYQQPGNHAHDCFGAGEAAMSRMFMYLFLILIPVADLPIEHLLSPRLLWRWESLHGAWMLAWHRLVDACVTCLGVIMVCIDLVKLHHLSLPETKLSVLHLLPTT